MTFSYSVSDLAASPKDQVRLAIGDVNQAAPLLQDEEIAFALTLRGSSIFGAAAECCSMIAGKQAMKFDTSNQNIRSSLSQLIRNWTARASYFEARCASSGQGTPYMGGISIADKAKVEGDSDRVAPNFNFGLTDNTLPSGAVGNETQSSNAQNDADSGT